MNILTPKTAAEMAEALAAANGKKTKLETGGNFSKPEWGGPSVAKGQGEAPTQRLSTAGLAQVLEYEPKDLTISVGAGLPWAELEKLLAANGQMVPVDPAMPETTTVGGAVACNLGGLRRRLFGSLRDLIIGMQFARIDGRLVQSGGMVVKNVAGLDMAKLLIGSYGTLGVITAVNFKIIPQPPETLTFLRRFASAEELLAVRNQILQGVLQPMALDAANPAAAKFMGLDGYCLLLQAGGSPAVMRRYQQELQGWEMIDCSIWSKVRDFTPNWLAGHAGAAMYRIPTTLQEMAAVLSRPAAVLARAATGISYLHTSELASANGNEVLEVGPVARKRELTQWNIDGNALATMEKIKEMLDPQRLLNEGRLYGRI